MFLSNSIWPSFCDSTCHYSFFHDLYIWLGELPNSSVKYDFLFFSTDCWFCHFLFIINRYCPPQIVFTNYYYSTLNFHVHVLTSLSVDATSVYVHMIWKLIIRNLMKLGAKRICFNPKEFHSPSTAFHATRPKTDLTQDKIWRRPEKESTKMCKKK